MAYLDCPQCNTHINPKPEKVGNLYKVVGLSEPVFLETFIKTCPWCEVIFIDKELDVINKEKVFGALRERGVSV